ncbi:hypothetical protein LSI54_00005, partial [Nesterenkonia sp. AY15]|uniref:hypothetical protein n=1 Tax=Nesterenkonia sp. AY15 TaxID=2901139 RepID=UPI001F4CCF41
MTDSTNTSQNRQFPESAGDVTPRSGIPHASRQTTDATDQFRSGPASASRPSTGQSTSDQGSSEQGRSDQATSDQAKSDQAKSDQAKSAAQDVAGDAKDAGRAVKDTAAQEAAGVKDDA